MKCDTVCYYKAHDGLHMDEAQVVDGLNKHRALTQEAHLWCEIIYMFSCSRSRSQHRCQVISSLNTLLCLNPVWDKPTIDQSINSTMNNTVVSCTKNLLRHCFYVRLLICYQGNWCSIWSKMQSLKGKLAFWAALVKQMNVNSSSWSQYNLSLRVWRRVHFLYS